MQDEFYERLYALATPCGTESADLRLGRWVVRLEGLDAPLAAELRERWGPFLSRSRDKRPTTTLAVFDAQGPPWLPSRPDAQYRMEPHGPPSRRAIVSLQFAVCADRARPGSWKLGLARGPEHRSRMVENAVRFVAANLAVDDGGFAMHAAGVLHGGRAFLFAGPSRAGKTTAVAASGPAASLGDDFGLVYRDADTWMAPALPFDGSERIGPGAARGVFPVAAIWRLYRSDTVRVDRPSPRVAVASLLSCAAFPWAYPERADELLDHVQRFVADGGFAHLHFDRQADLYSAVLGGSRRVP